MLTIVTATYNSIQFVRKNIDSARKQAYKDFDHIFIDAFSTDGTVEAIKEYQKEFSDRVKLVQLPPKGIPNAQNEGIKRAAAGSYILVLHADDSLFDENVLADVSSFLENNKLDWIYGKICVVNGEGKQLGFTPTKKIWQQNYRSIFGRYILKFYNYIPHQGVFMKKDVFEKFGYFDESMNSATDPDMYYRVKDHTTWSFFDRVISNFGVHAGSQTASKKQQLQNRKNFSIVQSRYMNPLELLLAKVVNLAVRIKSRSIGL